MSIVVPMWGGGKNGREEEKRYSGRKNLGGEKKEASQP